MDQGFSTAVSVNLGTSSACDVVVVVAPVDSVAVGSPSIKGFFCFKRTNNGDCFSGNGGITSRTVAKTVGLQTSLKRRYSIARC